jgi:hypothetical protein
MVAIANATEYIDRAQCRELANVSRACGRIIARMYECANVLDRESRASSHESQPVEYAFEVAERAARRSAADLLRKTIGRDIDHPRVARCARLFAYINDDDQILRVLHEKDSEVATGDADYIFANPNRQGTINETGSPRAIICLSTLFVGWLGYDARREWYDFIDGRTSEVCQVREGSKTEDMQFESDGELTYLRNTDRAVLAFARNHGPDDMFAYIHANASRDDDLRARVNMFGMSRLVLEMLRRSRDTGDDYTSIVKHLPPIPTTDGHAREIAEVLTYIDDSVVVEAFQQYFYHSLFMPERFAMMARIARPTWSLDRFMPKAIGADSADDRFGNILINPSMTCAALRMFAQYRQITESDIYRARSTRSSGIIAVMLDTMSTDVLATCEIFNAAIAHRAYHAIARVMRSERARKLIRANIGSADRQHRGSPDEGVTRTDLTAPISGDYKRTYFDRVPDYDAGRLKPLWLDAIIDILAWRDGSR